MFAAIGPRGSSNINYEAAMQSASRIEEAIAQKGGPQRSEEISRHVKMFHELMTQAAEMQKRGVSPPLQSKHTELLNQLKKLEPQIRALPLSNQGQNGLWKDLLGKEFSWQQVAKYAAVSAMAITALSYSHSYLKQGPIPSENGGANPLDPQPNGEGICEKPTPFTSIFGHTVPSLETKQDNLIESPSQNIPPSTQQYGARKKISLPLIDADEPTFTNSSILTTPSLFEEAPLSLEELNPTFTLEEKNIGELVERFLTAGSLLFGASVASRYYISYWSDVQKHTIADAMAKAAITKLGTTANPYYRQTYDAIMKVLKSASFTLEGAADAIVNSLTPKYINSLLYTKAYNGAIGSGLSQAAQYSNRELEQTYIKNVARSILQGAAGEVMDKEALHQYNGNDDDNPCLLEAKNILQECRGNALGKISEVTIRETAKGVIASLQRQFPPLETFKKTAIGAFPKPLPPMPKSRLYAAAIGGGILGYHVPKFLSSIFDWAKRERLNALRAVSALSVGALAHARFQSKPATVLLALFAATVTPNLFMNSTTSNAHNSASSD